jgi:hypothetical protein
VTAARACSKERAARAAALAALARALAADLLDAAAFLAHFFAMAARCRELCLATRAAALRAWPAALAAARARDLADVLESPAWRVAVAAEAA